MSLCRIYKYKTIIDPLRASYGNLQVYFGSTFQHKAVQYLGHNDFALFHYIFLKTVQWCGGYKNQLETGSLLTSMT